MMKRLWIGIGLLAAIVIAGFWTSSRMEDIHTDISDKLTDSAEAAQAGRWGQADTLARQAEDAWQGSWDLSAALSDHTVLDEIDGLLAQAKIYRQNRDDVAYAAVCARLATAIEALQEAHSLNWRNIL
jgi:hypothetical protein